MTVMFLVRTAFWLSIVVLLLPSDAQQQAKLYSNASNAVAYAATYCDRNATVCSQGSQLWAAFKTKLEFGARLAFDVASERVLGPTSKPQTAGVAPAGGTLTPADLSVPWRGRRLTGV